MTSFWRFRPGRAKAATRDAQDTPDWVHPFLTLDELWQRGRASAHSSGSTGHPKERTFQASWVHASARGTAAHFQLDSASDKAPLLAWSPLPISGVGGRMMWWRSRILGWDLTQTKPSTAPSVPIPSQGRDRFDFSVATPQQAHALLHNGGLSRLSVLLLGGAPIPPALEHDLLAGASDSGCQIHHGFGMTETLTHVATRSLGTMAYRPLAGVEFNITPQGALEIHAPNRGVHRLITRDAAAPHPDGLSAGFLWKGRLDDVINTGGVKVHPAELEQTLSPVLTPLLHHRRWYLVGRAHPQTGQEVSLVIEGTSEGNSSLEKTIFDQLRAACPGSERPRRIEWLGKMEETATGKVLRR